MWWIDLQSQTTKVHIFDNSWTRVFCNKLTSDLDSAPSKAPRNGTLQNFSWHFGACQNFEQNLCYYKFHALVNSLPRQLSYPLTSLLELSLPSPTHTYDLFASLPPMQQPLQSVSLVIGIYKQLMSLWITSFSIASANFSCWNLSHSLISSSSASPSSSITSPLSS